MLVLPVWSLSAFQAEDLLTLKPQSVMVKEYLDVLDSDGNKTGVVKERTLVHRDGIAWEMVLSRSLAGTGSMALMDMCRIMLSSVQCFMWYF